MSIDPTAIIHPSAVVEEGAVIGPGCRIGPFSLVGPKVRLGRGVELKSHVVIAGDTSVGDETTVYSFAVLGEAPQDLKYRGEDSRLVIGARNRIREHVTMNLGTEGGGMETRIGDDCLVMTGAHIGHDCHVGSGVILVNCVALAGHCVIEDNVIVGGLSGVHQWVRIGRGAIIGAVTMVTADVLPYGLVQGPRGQLDGLNLVGLKRRGAPREEIRDLRRLYARLSEGNFRESARAAAEEAEPGSMSAEVLDFILGPSDRSFLTPH